MTARGAPALALVGAAAALAGPACSGRAPEHDGIGNWRFPHTRLQNIKDGLCQPSDLSDGRKATWCFAQPPIRIGKSNAEVDLYFLGTEPSAPLIEIQLKVRGCHEDELEQWLRTQFGAPIVEPSETGGGAPDGSAGGAGGKAPRGIGMRAQRAYWKNSFLWIGALMPSDPGRCLVHVLPLSENAEIDRIKQR